MTNYETTDNIEGILFDFDGTLADTMQDNFKAWKFAFGTYKVEIKEEDYFPLEGLQIRKVAEQISSKYNIKNNTEQIIKLKEEHFKKNYKFKTYEGVEDLVNQLKEKYIKTAIVTAATLDRLIRTVPNDFLNKFDTLVTGDRLRYGKPHAEPFELALKSLNLKSSQAIVVENAPLGIRSAKEAGCYCIAIESTLDKSHLKEADIILSKFIELKELEIVKKLLEKKLN